MGEVSEQPDRSALAPVVPNSDNVVPFPTAGSASDHEAPVLSPLERTAFSELARRLTARLAGEVQDQSEPPADEAAAQSLSTCDTEPNVDDPLDAGEHPGPADWVYADAISADALAAIGREMRARIDAIVDLAHPVLAQSGKPAGEIVRDRLRAISAQCERMSEQMDDYLLLSDLRSGRLDLVPVPCDINEIVRENLPRLRTLAERGRLVIRLSLAATLPPVSTDRGLAGRIVSNLLANAAETTPAGGQIIVSTAASHDRSVCLRVRGGGDPGEQDADRQQQPTVTLEHMLAEILARVGAHRFAASAGENGILAEVAFTPGAGAFRPPSSR